MMKEFSKSDLLFLSFFLFMILVQTALYCLLFRFDVSMLQTVQMTLYYVEHHQILYSKNVEN